MRDQKMTSTQPLRALRAAPTLLIAAFLMAAGCASAPKQPPLSPSTGGERVPVDPSGGKTDPEDLGDIGNPGDDPVFDPPENIIGDGGLTPAAYG